MMAPRVLWCLGCLMLMLARPAHAQEAPALQAHRVVVEGGLVWSGSYPLGDASAQLRTNAVGVTPPPFTLFSTSSRVGSVASASVRLGFTLTPRLLIEGGGAFGMPRVGIAITQDTEGAGQQLEGEELQQYFFDGAVMWHVPVRLGSPRHLGGLLHQNC